MTDAINTNNRLKAPVPPSNNQTKSPSKGASSSAAGSPASAVELSSDQILKEIERLPDVNSGRIESIKNALANGEYKPDAEVIARKFSEIENLLP